MSVASGINNAEEPMDGIWQIIWTPATAVSVVLGVLATILTTYFQRRLDKWSSNWSATRRARYERQNAMFHARIQLLEAQPELLPLYIAREGRLRWTGFGQLAFGAIAFCMAPLISLESSGVAGSTVLPLLAVGLALAALLRSTTHISGANYHAAVLDALLHAATHDDAESAPRTGIVL